MLNIAHGVIGASIAAACPNPKIGLALALISHPLADSVPHWDFNIRHNSFSKSQLFLVALTDAFQGWLLGWLIFSQQVNNPTYLFSAIILAQLPDWLEGPYHVFNWKFPPFSWVKKFQSFFHNKLDLPWGFFSQFAVALLLALVVKK